MRPHLENKVAEVKEEEDDRDTMTHCEKIVALLSAGERQPGAVGTRGDGEMERRGDEDRDHRDEEEGRVELSCSGLDGLLGKAHTASEEAPVVSGGETIPLTFPGRARDC